MRSRMILGMLLEAFHLLNHCYPCLLDPSSVAENSSNERANWLPTWLIYCAPVCGYAYLIQATRSGGRCKYLYLVPATCTSRLDAAISTWQWFREYEFVTYREMKSIYSTAKRPCSALIAQSRLDSAAALLYWSIQVRLATWKTRHIEQACQMRIGFSSDRNEASWPSSTPITYHPFLRKIQTINSLLHTVVHYSNSFTNQTSNLLTPLKKAWPPQE